MKNQAYYDNLDLSRYDDHECHVERQFRDSIAFRIFALLACGVGIGAIVYAAFFVGMGL